MKTLNRNTHWFPNVLDDFFLQNTLDVPRHEKFTRPSINIIQNDSNYVIEMAAPGLTKKDFIVEVEEETLLVSSSLSEDKIANSENDNKNFTKREFNFTNFKRSFNLPELIDKEEIKAKYTNGILEITINKIAKPEEVKKMIEIS